MFDKAQTTFVKNKSIRWIIYLIPIVFALVCYAVNYKRPISYDFEEAEIGLYSDQLEKYGKSTIQSSINHAKALVLSYRLDSAYSYPYVGAYISKKEMIDLSVYDELIIELSAKHSKRIPIHIMLDVEGHTKADEGLSFRPLIQEIEYIGGKQRFEIPLSDFRTHAWWFANQNKTESELGKANLKRVSSVNIQNCQLVPYGVDEQMTIYYLSFRRNNYKDVIYLLPILLIVYGFIFFIDYSVIKKQKYVLLGNPTDMSDKFSEDQQRVLNYISTHYTNPDLTSTVVQKELGVTELMLSEIIKTVSGQHFKAYVNALRLEEAKRLLKTTDRNVSEIAFSVGYNHPTHFNRVFKSTVGMSPNEFRKNH